MSTGQPLIMYALSHHLSSFNFTTAAATTNISLTTTTKGNATAVLADSWTMVESNLPTDMGFAPWNPSTGTNSQLSNNAISAIMSVASDEVNQNMSAQTNLNSMYFAGKAFSKFASIIYTINDLANDTALAHQGLAQLKNAFARFLDNQQIFPLVYDTVWGGIVSSASYSYQTNDSGADFGNTYYNDHHFHYGYFIHAAAVIGYLDPTWAAENKDWVNALVRDVASPSLDDNYFPLFRSFDWYHGHSWAKGLFESADSKDQESTSEDVMFAYAMKMWGQVIGDAAMEARGNLMMSVLTRSIQHYFLLDSDNTIQPANFIGNKVTGIVSLSSFLAMEETANYTALRQQNRSHHILWQQSRVHPGVSTLNRIRSSLT
jgi:endo-1,3(4)-beta-glucanase